MKLVLAIVSNDDASKVIKALVKHQYYVTKLATTGGFLMTGNTTFLIGCSDEQVDNCISVIEEFSKSRSKIVPNSITSEYGMFSSTPVEVQVGGATVFVVDVEKFVKL